jgi:hypothetical protein
MDAMTAMTEDLTLLADRYLNQARQAEHGRSAHLFLHDGPLRQSVIALTAGAALEEHNAPPAASIQVLRGRVRLDVTDDDGAVADSVEVGAGQLTGVPQKRHALAALEDAVVLFTTVTATDGTHRAPAATTSRRERVARPAEAPHTAPPGRRDSPADKGTAPSPARSPAPRCPAGPGGRSTRAHRLTGGTGHPTRDIAPAIPGQTHRPADATASHRGSRATGTDHGPALSPDTLPAPPRPDPAAVAPRAHRLTGGTGHPTGAPDARGRDRPRSGAPTGAPT